MESRSSRREALVLSSLADIESLRSSPERLWRLNRPIELRLQHIPQPERKQLEYRLNELSETCGCAQGSAAGAISIIIVIFAWIQRGYTLTFRLVFISLATVIFVSLVGKLVSVISARIRLHHTLTKLLRTAPKKLTSTEEQIDEPDVHRVLRLG
jgi:hypothetical protein